MAVTTLPQTQTETAPHLETESFWERPLTAWLKWDWEKILLIALLLVAIVTRFWDLGARSYNHDESIHTNYSFSLYQGKGYVHNPTYHGPLLYHLTALTFFLLGDNDVTGRVPNVVMGLIILTLPFFFRKWLGKRGWFVTAFLLLISPVVTYYSRFNRHDVYVEVFVLLMLLSILKYLDTRQDKWIYASAAALALSFTAMETTFIFVALFGYALTSLFTIQWLNANPNIKWSSTQKILAGVFFGVPFFVAALAFFLYRSVMNLRDEEGRDLQELPAFDLAVLCGTLSLPFTFTPVILKVAGVDPAGVPGTFEQGLPYGIALLAVILLAASIGLIWSTRRWGISALLFFPIVLFFFTTVFTNLAGVFTGMIGSLGYWLSQQDVARGGQPWYYYIAVQLPFYEYLPYLFAFIGMWWAYSKRGYVRMILPFVWLGAVFTFWLFFSGANPQPDWLKYTPVLAALTIPLVAFGAYDSGEGNVPFQLFIYVWMMGDLIIFSWAGEKMPWLTMHLTIPLAFASGYFMDGVLNANWRELYQRGAHWFALLFIAGFFILALQLFFGPQVLSGVALDSLNHTLTLFFAFIVLAAILVGLYIFANKLGGFNTVRLIAVSVFVLLAAFTIHSNALASYYYSDVANELIIYAQGTPDVPIAMKEIEDLSRRLCAQIPEEGKPQYNCDNGTIKVAYDDDSSWPFVWYLRNYRNQQYYGKSPGAPFDAEVVIVGPANEQAVKPFLGNRYYRREMKLIWWPLENYKDLTWTRLFGGTDATGAPVKAILSWDNIQSTLRDIWFYHHYQESFSNWPYRHTFALYIRKDVAASLWDYSGVAGGANPSTTEDEYAKKFIPNVAAQSVIGALGNQPGQLNNPRALAFDAEGNLYVADSGNQRIEKFDPGGKFLMTIGAGVGSGNGQFADGPGGAPWGIAVDKDGNIYATDTWNHRVEKFDKNGNFILSFGHPYDPNKPVIAPTDDLSAFFGPRDIAIDANGNLWITDTGNKRVVEYDPNGKPLAGFGGTGGDPGQFLEPVGISVDAQGNFYVADTWNQRIQKFDQNFSPLAQWTIEAWDSQSVLNKPFITTDSKGDIYVTDPDNFRVLEYASDGTLLAVFGAKGNDLTNFETPTGIAIGPDGKLYVVDSGNSRVLVFNPVK